MSSYAAHTGLIKPVERPRPTSAGKPTAEDHIKKSQRILLTWLLEEPEIYPKIKAYISAADFTQELYRQVADKLFAGLEQGTFSPASVVSAFEEEEEQREVAAIFNTKLERLNTKQEREKALHDVLMAVKDNSFQYYSARMGADMEALNQVISGKKALEELRKAHISL